MPFAGSYANIILFRRGKCDKIKEKGGKTMNLWEEARNIEVQTSDDIVGGFSIGFDKQIPEETKDELTRFAYWVEDNYNLPVTLWVDFKYKHYLVNRDKQRVGYKFYWVDFDSFPVFDNWDDLPVIELPVRTEDWTMEEILASFIEAITCYFAWLTGRMTEGYEPDPDLVEQILQTYLKENA